eukprot:7999879-Karenia_brevis.AAC.1
MPLGRTITHDVTSHTTVTCYTLLSKVISSIPIKSWELCIFKNMAPFELRLLGVKAEPLHGPKIVKN